MTTEGAAEDVKRLLVENAPEFALEDAWDATKTYKIVFYTAAPPLVEQQRRWKVDILVPGDLHIPFIPETRFIRLSTDLPETSYTLPCMPLLPLLILKLQAWCIIRNDKQRKDLHKLLALAVHSGVNSTSFQSLPESFVEMARGWAWDFVSCFPDSQEGWEQTGFIQTQPSA